MCVCDDAVFPWHHASQTALHRLFIDWIGEQPRVRQQTVYTILLWGTRRAGRSLRSGGTRDTMRPDSNSQTDGQQEVVTVYNVLQQGVFTSNHLFLIYRWESRGRRITGASTMEPPSVLVTPPRLYVCLE